MKHDWIESDLFDMVKNKEGRISNISQLFVFN